MKNIALVGYSRVGKDSVGEIIRNSATGYYQRVAYGDILKEELFRMFPNLPKEPKPRMEMEVFGKGMRDVDQNVWINKLDERINFIKTEFDPNANFIITDLRQMNEYHWARKNEFTIINVIADRNQRIKRATGDTVYQDVNLSELDLHLIPFDYQIVNNGTQARLKVQVLNVLKAMGVETWSLS